VADRLLAYDITSDLALDTEKLIKFISERYPIEIKREEIKPLMGKIEFNPLKITIDSTLDPHRLRFTLCHEIGHLVLHRNLLDNKADKVDDEYTLSLNNNVFDLNTRRIEIQAN